MNKAIGTTLAISAMVLVSGICYAAFSPVESVVVHSPRTATTARESTPNVLTASEVLIVVNRAKDAPKPVRVAKKTIWTCGDWETSAVGGAYKRCEWR